MTPLSAVYPHFFSTAASQRVICPQFSSSVCVFVACVCGQINMQTTLGSQNDNRNINQWHCKSGNNFDSQKQVWTRTSRSAVFARSLS